MLCLRCNAKTKQTILEGVLIDWCEVCNSIWLDEGELEKIRTGRQEDITELSKQAKAERMSRGKMVVVLDHLCPKCSRGEMCYWIEEGIKLDKCTFCGGLFFDKGEIDPFIKKGKNHWLTKLKKVVSSLCVK